MYKKVMHVVKQVVYWASLVGPMYSLVKGTIDGFVSAVQAIRADEKLKQEIYAMENLPTEYVDLSRTLEARNFGNVCDVIEEVKNDNAI